MWNAPWTASLALLVMNVDLPWLRPVDALQLLAWSGGVAVIGIGLSWLRDAAQQAVPTAKSAAARA